MLLIVAALLVAGCPASDCFCVPVVREVQLLPQVVYASPGDVFELKARLLDRDGKEIPEFFGIRPQWEGSPDGALRVLERIGHGAILEVDEGAHNDVKIVAEAAPGIIGTVIVTIVRDSDLNDDQLRADHTRGQLLKVAMVDDEVSDWRDARLFAFTRMAPLGALQDPNTGNADVGGILVFSPDREMTYVEAPWTPASNPVDIRNPTIPDPPVFAGHPIKGALVVPLQIYLARTAPGDDWSITAEAITRIHAADASRIFERNRTGITFEVASVRWLDGVVDGCSAASLPTSTAVDNAYVSHPIVAAEHNVFYVDLGHENGYTCRDASGNPRVFMNTRNPYSTTLAHELGHILGLDEMDDLGAHNLMKQGDDDEPRIRRSRLSLGQLCLMNWNRTEPRWPSFLATSTRSTPTPPKRCPAPTADIP